MLIVIKVTNNLNSYVFKFMFTNKCIKFVRINIKFMQNFKMIMLISLSLHIKVTTYVVHINIKFMQQLEHAHAQLSSQINVIT